MKGAWFSIGRWNKRGGATRGAERQIPEIDAAVGDVAWLGLYIYWHMFALRFRRPSRPGDEADFVTPKMCHYWLIYIYYIILCYNIVRSLDFDLELLNATSHQLDYRLSLPVKNLVKATKWDIVAERLLQLGFMRPLECIISFYDIFWTAIEVS